MTDAPKIDTQAPERIWASPEHDGENDYGGFWIKAKVAPSVEYIRADLSAAREAAAWIAGRDAALADYIEWDELECLPSVDLVANSIRAITPPTDPAAALDRLIAERVREAVDRVSKLFEGCASRLVPDDYAQGYREALQHVRDAVRGSKEGRDG